MKTIIRFLSDVFGVTEDIVKEERTRIGYKLRDDAYWYNGGLLVKGRKPDVKALLWIYGEGLLKLGRLPDTSRTRQSIFEKDHVYDKAVNTEDIKVF